MEKGGSQESVRSETSSRRNESRVRSMLDRCVSSVGLSVGCAVGRG